ncbi:MAG: bifunctional diaminohydroxyphosphoribosylaminopyrimidine deaminase/5-amino-6-(5-phosphoribosylamino)uracil reductase RibD [Victivallaceae bacterium]
MNHTEYMKLAIKLAESAWGMTSPNPLVGAVIVTDGQIVGRGYHHRAGEPHAEVNALRDAGTSAAGADIYVTLEPCSTHGRTPPCTEAIIQSGIKRVFIGSTDPNPAHAGKGAQILKKAGIEVFCGIEKELCDRLNEAFFKWITLKKPFVILKMAMTLDGKIATADGESKWITGPEARARVQQLRKWADAIMVGGETVRRDCPSLTVRDEPEWLRQPERIIASRTFSPEELQEYFPEGNKPQIISASSPAEWNNILLQLGEKQITALLIEGGGELAAEVLRAGIVDQIEFHIAPKILGGRDSRTVVGGKSPMSLAETLQLSRVKVETAGPDIIISGYLK